MFDDFKNEIKLELKNDTEEEPIHEPVKNSNLGRAFLNSF